MLTVKTPAQTTRSWSTRGRCPVCGGRWRKDGVLILVLVESDDDEHVLRQQWAHQECMAAREPMLFDIEEAK